jgi:putative flavoprotein involved in K+ transport
MADDRVRTLVIGGSQAGVSIGYFLQQAGDSFRIVDAGTEIGAPWRSRWDSLKLFTEAKYNNLPGTRFPGDPEHIPGKDEMADYLREYAARFDLPIELGVEVGELSRADGTYVAVAGDRQILADRVVVATGPTGQPRVPGFAEDLAPAITQLHSADYRNPAQLPDGPALVVGAGNSGAEIAIELAAGRQVWLAGPDVGKFPFRLGSPVYRVMNRLLTTHTPMGRKIAGKTGGGGTPLVRLRPEDVIAAGVRRVDRLGGVVDGQPKLADGTVLEPASIVWATGYSRNYDWIKLPILGPTGDPVHDRGVVKGEPGLYFLGLPFMYSMASSLIMGVTQDAKYTGKVITAGRG